MSLKTKLENDLREAMKSKDVVSKKAIRMVLSSVKLAEIEKKSSLDDVALHAILHKEIKSRLESIADAEKVGRKDIISETEAEIAVLERYLPSQLSAQELEALARDTIASVGATTIREMGQVMKELIPRLEGRATGDQASQVVRKLLS